MSRPKVSMNKGDVVSISLTKEDPKVITGLIIRTRQIFRGKPEQYKQLTVAVIQSNSSKYEEGPGYLIKCKAADCTLVETLTITQNV